MTLLATLRPPAPYNLALTAELLGRYHGVLDIEDGGDYLRALNIGGEAALVRVREMNTPAAPELRVELVAGDSAHADAALDKITWMLATDLDLAPFYAFARAEQSRLWQVIQPLNGLRHFRSETIFEALANVIIEQQISLYAALRAQRAVAEWGGACVEHNGVRYYTFPTVETIAEADHETLHQLTKITHRRVDLIQRLAREVVDGAFDVEGLRAMSGADAYARLLVEKGVGHWTAAWTLVRGLGDYSYVGHNDVALRSAVAHYFYDTDERVSADAVAETFAAFGEYAGIAAFYTLMRWAVDRY